MQPRPGHSPPLPRVTPIPAPHGPLHAPIAWSSRATSCGDTCSAACGVCLAAAATDDEPVPIARTAAAAAPHPGDGHHPDDAAAAAADGASTDVAAACIPPLVLAWAHEAMRAASSPTIALDAMVGRRWRGVGWWWRVMAWKGAVMVMPRCGRACNGGRACVVGRPARLPGPGGRARAVHISTATGAFER